MSENDEKKVNAKIYNFKTGWRYKLGAHANASGKWQIQAEASSDTLDLFVEEFVTLLEDSHRLMKERGFPPVEPKDKGGESK